MSLITRALQYQTAVYWPRAGIDLNGNPEFGTPVEINCRWDDQAVMYKDKDGRDAVSKAVVMVDRETPPGGALWLGTLAALEYQTDALANEGAYEIQQMNKHPNMTHTEDYIEAIL